VCDIEGDSESEETCMLLCFLCCLLLLAGVWAILECGNVCVCYRSVYYSCRILEATLLSALMRVVLPDLPRIHDTAGRLVPPDVRFGQASARRPPDARFRPASEKRLKPSVSMIRRKTDARFFRRPVSVLVFLCQQHQWSWLPRRPA
jgi:hypothetical protein